MKRILLFIVLLVPFVCGYSQDTTKTIPFQKETIITFSDAETPNFEIHPTYPYLKDKFRWGYFNNLTILPMTASGYVDVASNEYNPIYKWSDTLVLVMHYTLGASIFVPIIKKGRHSLGINLNAGLGYQIGIQHAKGWRGLSFDFPQYLYYRNSTQKTDYSVLLGYKYTIAPLNYKMPMIAFQISKNKSNIWSFYASILGDKYYYYLSNNTYKPALVIREFGISIVLVSSLD